jgi:gliding motility-associated-like protein
MIRCIVLVGLVCSHLCAYAQYATTGRGLLRDRVWWFNWSGIMLAEGASRTFTTEDGLTVTIVFSSVSKAVPVPAAMSNTNGSLLHLLYDFADPSIQPALFSAYSKDTCRFTMKITAARAGLAIPFTFIAADAEESDITESTTLQTDGSNWQTIEFISTAIQAINPLTGCHTRKVTIGRTEGNGYQNGQNPLVASGAIGAMQVQVEMNRHGIGGAMSVAFGIMSPVDRGDLPASYGAPVHQLGYTISNGCNYTAPLPSLHQVEVLKLGTMAGDADVQQTGDDNATGADEDGVGTFPVYKVPGAYSVLVNVTNTTNAVAWLTGWFDHNRNGMFEKAEASTVPVQPNATSVSITWRNLPKYLPAGTVSGCGFRFRLSSNIIYTQQPTGYAPDGEVEDYFVKTAALCAPPFAVTPTHATICQQESLVLSASGGDEYTWLGRDNSIIDSSASIKVLPAASQKYRVRITEYACNITDTFTIPVQVNELPVPAVSKSNDIDCIHGKAVLHATGGNSYNWNNGPGISNLNAHVVSPVVEPSNTTTYYVDVTNNKGCRVKDSVTVQVDFAKPISRYPMPNAFSPNNDGRNDCFGLKGWGRIQNLEMEVYNKWGQRVFATTDPSLCWDGRFNGVIQPTGGYVYSIKAATTCGLVYQKGVVMLVR